MHISILYYINKNTPLQTLKSSLNSLVNQSNKEFSLTIFNDTQEPEIDELLNKLPFDSIKSFTYVKNSKHLGIGYFYENYHSFTRTEWVVFAHSGMIFNAEYVKKLNLLLDTYKKQNFVVLSKGKNKKEVVNYTTEEFKELNLFLTPFMEDKIFNVIFLKSNNINFTNHTFYPLNFVFKALSKSSSATVLNSNLYELSEICTENDYYKIFDMLEDFLKVNEKNTFYANNKNLFQYFAVVLIICVFLPKVFLTYTEKIYLTNALFYSEKWLDTNIPDWEDNKIVDKKVKNSSSELMKLLQKFKFNVKTVNQLIDELYNKNHTYVLFE